MSSPCASTQARASCAGVQPFSLASVLDLVHQLEVVLEVLALEAGAGAPEVAGGQILG